MRKKEARTKEVGSFEAKVHLSELLQEANHGAWITITRRGHPIAQLIPYIKTQTSITRNQTLQRFSTIRKSQKSSVVIKDLINEGRQH